MKLLQKIIGNLKPTAEQYNVLVDRLNILSKIRGANGINVNIGNGGVNLTGGKALFGNIEVRRLKVVISATGSNQILCKKVNSVDVVVGNSFNVQCNISDGSAMNSVVRRLSSGDFITAFRFSDTWFCTEGFQNSEDC